MSDNGKQGKDPARWEQRYQDNELPWDSNKTDIHLKWAVEDFDVGPCKVVVVGCGTGTNAVWLDEAGFDVTGLDLSPTAITRARARAATAGATCEFMALDFMAGDLPPGPFSMAFDRGCFHCFDEAAERSHFASRVADVLDHEGLWISVIGSTDGPPRDTGPPRRSALDIALAIEPFFEVLHLEASVFDQHDHAHARAWVLVARKRIHYLQ